MLRPLRAAAIVLLMSLFGIAAAADLAPRDAAAVRDVIERQMEAFRRDDGAAAFALATDGIRQRFGSAATFLDMVRRAYPVVYRPGSVQFENPETIEGTIVQPVRLTDTEGRAWLALYPMQRLPDGQWRINGCQLSRLAGRET